MSTVKQSLNASLSQNNSSPFIISICIAVIGGIITQLFLSPYTWVTITSVLISCISISYTLKTLLNKSLFILLFYCFGIVLTQLHQPNKHHLIHQNLAKSTIVGTINEAPVLTKKGYKKVILKASHIQTPNNFTTTEGNIILYLKPPFSLNLQTKDTLVLKTTIRPTTPPQNPHEFNIQRYYSFHNIHHQAFCSEEDLKLLPYTSFSLKRLAHQFQDYLSLKLTKHIHNKAALETLKALLIGNRSGLTDDTIQHYSKSGAMHVLAVSGLHVGIFMLVISFLFKIFKLKNNWIEISITLLSIWLYAFVTGLSPSVMRAAIMFSFLLVGKLLNKNTHSLSTLAVSAFCMLCYNPFYITEVGFQLSFSAVIGIMYFVPKLESYFNLQSRYWLVQKTITITYVSIAAQLATAPIGLLYFHQFPSYFLFANLVVIPAAFLLVFIGALFFCFSEIPYVGKLLSLLLEGLSYGLNFSTEYVATLPGAAINQLHISVFECYLLLVLIVLGFKVIIDRKAIFTPYLFLSICALCFIQVKEHHTILQQKGFTVYAITKQTAIDIFEGKTHHFIASEKLLKDADKMEFHVQHNWYHKNFNAPQVSNQQNGLTIFEANKHKIGIVNKANCSSKTTIDYLIISNNSYTLDEVFEQFNFKKLIYDSSNSHKFLHCIKHSPRFNNNIVIVPDKGALTVNF